MGFKLKRKRDYRHEVFVTGIEKVSARLIPMAESVLRRPLGAVSPEASDAALLLAQSAWNRDIARSPRATRLLWYAGAVTLSEFEDSNHGLWTEFTSEDPLAVMEELFQFKQRHYPEDDRFIHECWMTDEGEVRVISSFLG